MRIIDADALKEHIRFVYGYVDKDNYDLLIDIIDNAPTLPNPCGNPCNFTRPTGEWIPVSKELPPKNGFYLVTVSGYGKRPHMKILGYDAINKKWGEGGVVAWCNMSPYEQEVEE